MSLTAQTDAVKTAIATLGQRIKTIQTTANNAPNAQQLEGNTLQQVLDLVSGTTNATIEDVENSLNAFIARTDNPHAVTQAQVGLGLVDNFATATEAEAVGTVFTYTAAASQTLLTGADDNTNTMNLSAQPGVYVTKNTGDVLAQGTDYTVNYATSEITLLTGATAGDVFEVRTVVGDRFIVTDVMWSVLETFWGDKLGSTPDALNTIQELAAALENNPDVVQNLTDLIATKATQSDIDSTVGALTKADIGLGNVQDFGVATNAEAVTGTSTTLYMTPANNKAASDALQAILQGNIDLKVDQTAFDTLETAFNTRTKADIGLGNVENLGLASQAEAEAGTSNAKYMTPLRTDQAIEVVRVPLQSDINSRTPQTQHDALQTQVNTLDKADIGLANVENYGIATETEALEIDPVLSTNAKYMTPRRVLDVRLAIDSEVNAALADIETAFNDAIAAIDAP